MWSIGSLISSKQRSKAARNSGVPERELTEAEAAWLSRKGVKAHLLAQGILIGGLVGPIITIYRMLIQKISSLAVGAAPDLSTGWRTMSLAALVFFLVYCFFGFLNALALKIEPLISGSGIPQVSAENKGIVHSCWWRVLLLKFVCGITNLGLGLTLGREGPSVQIGAMVGKGVAKVLRRPETEKVYLMSSGAAAGLTSAFLAPISGIVFALEELHRNFSPLALISAMSSTIISYFITASMLGMEPVLSFEVNHALPLETYGWLIVLGILIGLSGVLFNGGILLAKKLYSRVPPMLRTVIPFAATAVLILISKENFGNGEEMISWANGPLWHTVGELLGYYGLRLVLLWLCFGSGLAGGIFFPLLILGSLVGNAFATILTTNGLLAPEYILLISLVAMGGHFSAIVRAPLTGMMLVLEMTGSFVLLLPCSLVSLIAYAVAELCHSEPIYESLLEAMPEAKAVRQHLPKAASAEHRVLREYAIEGASLADEKYISEIAWPKEVLLVAVKRGGMELLPKGPLRLRRGDYIVVLMLDSDFVESNEVMLSLTKVGADVFLE